jgi:hypothetical protein
MLELWRALSSTSAARWVVDYVGRYTHRVAIANHRLLDMEGD